MNRDKALEIMNKASVLFADRLAQKIVDNRHELLDEAEGTQGVTAFDVWELADKVRDLSLMSTFLSGVTEWEKRQQAEQQAQQAKQKAQQQTQPAQPVYFQDFVGVQPVAQAQPQGSTQKPNRDPTHGPMWLTHYAEAALKGQSAKCYWLLGHYLLLPYMRAVAATQCFVTLLHTNPALINEVFARFDDCRQLGLQPAQFPDNLVQIMGVLFEMTREETLLAAQSGIIW